VLGGAGCIGPYAVVTVDAGVFFIGPDQIWLFDGSRPIPIADAQVRQWFFDDLSPTLRSNTRLLFDRARNRVLIFYPNQNSSGNPNACLVYHLVSRQWGRDDQTIECAFTYIQPGITWDSASGTWATTTLTWDSQELNPSARSPAVFGSDHIPYVLTGTPGASSFTTESFGDENTESFLTGIRLRYQQTPTTAQAIGYVLDEAGDTATEELTLASSDIPAGALNKFDLRQCARFHRVQFNFTGAVRVIGKRPEVQPAGGR
jgi:hypothetical protein